MIAALLTLLVQDFREVYAGERPIEVRVPVSKDAQHRASVVSFPEESLEALVAGWNEADLSIERRRENLFIKLLRHAQGDVHVLGASGTLYRLTIVPADGGAYDGRVRVLAPREQKRGTPESVELVRAMRLGRRPAEGTVLKSDRAIQSSPLLSSTIAWVYESNSYRGFVIRVENRSAAVQRIDPSRFIAKDLVLSGAREMLIDPGTSTLLYLVFWKSP